MNLKKKKYLIWRLSIKNLQVKLNILSSALSIRFAKTQSYTNYKQIAHSNLSNMERLREMQAKKNAY